MKDRPRRLFEEWPDSSLPQDLVLPPLSRWAREYRKGYCDRRKPSYHLLGRESRRTLISISPRCHHSPSYEERPYRGYGVAIRYEEGALHPVGPVFRTPVAARRYAQTFIAFNRTFRSLDGARP